MNSAKFDAETLMAYVDGELDVAQSAAVEQALQTDVQLATYVQQQHDLKARLRSSFDAQLAEPMNERLLNTLRATAAVQQDAKVIDLAQARQRNEIHANGWRAREWSAMAASLLFGLLIGAYALNFNGDKLLATHAGQLIAQGSLAKSLATQLASETDQPIKMGISFRNHAGQYCRSFNIQQSKSLAGIACHADRTWRIHLLTESTNRSSEFRQADSATPDAVLAWIDKQIQGEPLDADDEAKAQRSGWQ